MISEMATVAMTALLVCMILILIRGESQDSEVKLTLRKRLDVLKVIARSAAKTKKDCSKNTFVYISEYPFGNSGNHIISLSHGLWVANQLNATFIIPNWIEASLKHFDLSILDEGHCFTTNPAIPTNTKNYAVTSEESFFTFKLFRDKGLPFIPLLPEMNTKTIMDISAHFLRVYAALWSSPTENVVSAGQWIIENHLQQGFNFTSIHKRNLDGGCGKIMSENTKPEDFSNVELPMDSPEWHGNLRAHHPLCEMSLDFVKRTMALNGRAERSLFVAHDGQGDVSSYRLHKAVFGSVMAEHPEFSKIPMKFVDMFVAMHADFFIQNPRSTFSLQIYIVRVCLGLQSVPIVSNNDIFLQRVPQDLLAADRPLWVSWTSLQAAYKEHFAQL